MGGQEGSRGYLYQSVISIIDACDKLDWEYISVEETTPEDKVDIAFLDKSEKVLSAIQVKSSVNQFTVGDMQSWIKAMVDDISCDSYCLYLIGNCGNKANRFIKSVSKYYDGKIDNEVKESVSGFITTLENHKIYIDIFSYNQEHLLKIAESTLNRFVGSMGYIIDSSTLEQLTYALITMSMLWGTSGQRISKKDYIQRIKNWIECSAAGRLKTEKNYSNIEIGCYDFLTGQISSNYQLKKATDNYDFSNEISSLLKIGDELIPEINSIKLSSYVQNDDDVIFENKEDFSNIEKLSKLATQESFSAEMNKSAKENLQKNVMKYWSIELPDDFCNAGNLKRNNFFKGLNEKLIGTESEENKHSLLSKLRSTITKLNEIEYFKNIIKPMFILPLCITNTSEIADKDITVTLEISNSELHLFDLNNDIDEDNKEMLNALATWILNDKNNILDKVFSPHQNDKVNMIEEIKIPYSMSVHKNPYFFSSNVEFEDILEAYALYQPEIDSAGNIVYEISSLRPGETVWLSPYIIATRNEHNIELPYSILSDSLGKKKTGNIIIA